MTALIAMSGGVDSAVAAYLTQLEGLNCEGATMLLAPQELSPEEITRDARSVAQRLGIPFHVVDFTQEFQEAVMDKFATCYECGLTPSPCIDCNRDIKFSAFLDWARDAGCDFIVTGHYAQVVYDPQLGRYLLKKAEDKAKDQSYFLYALTQDQLSRTRFPLGTLTKDRVREIAEAQGFVNARKRDSQDICFIPDGDYLSFLERYTGHSYAAGDFLDLEGKTVGQHRGAVAYTLGQRKGLGLAMGAPVYVCDKDMAANTVTVGPNEALYRTSLRAADWNWIAFPQPEALLRCMAKARSRMTEQPATVYPEENGVARVVFDQPQRALTPGQAVVLYDGDTVLGGGTVTEIL